MVATAAGQCWFFCDTVTDGAFVLVYAVNEAVVITIIASRHDMRLAHENVDPLPYNVVSTPCLFVNLHAHAQELCTGLLEEWLLRIKL